MKDNLDYDVVVVGFGPTGATLANLLGLKGLSVLVLEKEPEAYHLPRAVHMDDEVMRVFQTIGVADEINENLFVNRGMRFVDAKGELLLDWPRPQELGPQNWYASYRFHQPYVEVSLRNGLKRFKHVDVKTSCEFVKAVNGPKSVEVSYEDLTDQTHHTINAQYIVGCDGARSPVREAMKSEWEDYGFNERWLVVDVILKKEKPELGDHTIQYCNPERPATYCRSPGMRRRWEISVRDGEDAAEIVKDEKIWELLKDWLTPEDADLERQAVYTFQSKVAWSWRKERMLIAGDAAHLTPPFMGQGMCAGIRDAANLAWKLILVCKGKAEEYVLDTYESERRPLAKKYIQTAKYLGGVINTMGSKEELNNAFRQSDGSVKMESIIPELGPGLGDMSSPHRGFVCPQPCLSARMPLDEYIGFEPVLIAVGEIASDINDVGYSVLSSEDNEPLTKMLSDMNVKALLVRPDRYIMGSANNLNEARKLVSQSSARLLN